MDNFIIIFGIFISMLTRTSISFDRNCSGVVFDPFVKFPVRGESPSPSSYTFGDITTMLEVVSNKFSRVLVFPMMTRSKKYVPEHTYFNESYIDTRTAEAVATINSKRNNVSLSVIVGVNVNNSTSDAALTTQMNVVIESIQIANQIFPESAKSIVLNFNLNESNKTQYRTFWDETWSTGSTLLLDKLRKIRGISGTRVGITENCDDWSFDAAGSLSITTDFSKLPRWVVLRDKLYREADFVLCMDKESRFQNFSNDYLLFRENLKQIKKDLEVMVATGSLGKANETLQDIRDRLNYWRKVDKLAKEFNFQVYFYQAFDVPKKHSESGWWKLKSNDVINDASGYIEKISALPPGERSENDTSSETHHSMETSKFAEEMSKWIGVGVGATTLSILVVVVVCFCKYKRSEPHTYRWYKEDLTEFMYGKGIVNVEGDFVSKNVLKAPYNPALEIRKEMIEIEWNEILGVGQFSQVFKAKIKKRDGSEEDVALKITNVNSPPTALKGVLSEIKILTYLWNHPSVVSICGAYTAEMSSGLIYIATELCHLGPLKDYLANSRTKCDITVHEHDLYRWCHEIVCGMEYLGKMKVVHGNLAARNVLLSADKTAKISDFTLSTRLYDYTVYMKQWQSPFPWKWMAIESLKQLIFTVQSDVWSYGVTLYEIFSYGNEPYPCMSWSLGFIESLDNGLRLPQPNSASKEIYEIMTLCWNLDPNLRPTFHQLKLDTEKIRLTHEKIS